MVEGFFSFSNPLYGVWIAEGLAAPGQVQRLRVGRAGSPGVSVEIQGLTQGQLIGRVFGLQRHRLSGLGQGTLRISRAGWPARGPCIKKSQGPIRPTLLHLGIRLGCLPEELLDSRQSV